MGECVAFQAEQYLQRQWQLMTQPAAMKSSSVGPALAAAFACTGTAAVGVAGTEALSALASSSGAPMLRRYATTSVSLRPMAYLSAVLQLLQGR